MKLSTIILSLIGLIILQNNASAQIEFKAHDNTYHGFYMDYPSKYKIKEIADGMNLILLDTTVTENKGKIKISSPMCWGKENGDGCKYKSYRKSIKKVAEVEYHCYINLKEYAPGKVKTKKYKNSHGIVVYRFDVAYYKYDKNGAVDRSNKVVFGPVLFTKLDLNGSKFDENYFLECKRASIEIISYNIDYKNSEDLLKIMDSFRYK